jgi:prepilin-type N-terminal cleavage/methylation domain-containing protein
MHKKGFTLIELIVVVGIIIVLVGILVPAVGKARIYARQAETESMMTGLSTAIQAYYEAFHAYPGPASADYTTGAQAGKKISGSQNLLLGLSYSMIAPPPYNPVPPPTSPVINLPFWNGARVECNNPGTVINYANIRPDGSPEKFGAFFDVSAKTLSKPNPGPTAPNLTWPNGGVAGAGTNNFAFPVPVDTFSDGLPILYYRRTPGVNGVALSYSPTTPSGYYYNENVEYTNTTTLVATSGSVISQQPGNMYSPGPGVTELNSRVTVGGGATGGFVLISAGIDRIYGRVASNSNRTDDIVKVGGN